MYNLLNEIFEVNKLYIEEKKLLLILTKNKEYFKLLDVSTAKTLDVESLISDISINHNIHYYTTGHLLSFDIIDDDTEEKFKLSYPNGTILETSNIRIELTAFNATKLEVLFKSSKIPYELKDLGDSFLIECLNPAYNSSFWTSLKFGLR